MVKDARRRSSRLDFWRESRVTPDVRDLAEVPGLAERGDVSDLRRLDRADSANWLDDKGEVEGPAKSSEADRVCGSCGAPEASPSRLRRGCGANVSTACRS